MRDEIVDLNDSDTFTKREYMARHGVTESGAGKRLAAMVAAGSVVRVSPGVYKSMGVAKASVAKTFDTDVTEDVSEPTLDDVMAAMDLGWLEGKAIELIAHHDSAEDVEQAICCLQSILKHQYSG